MGGVVFSVSGTRVTRGQKALQAFLSLCQTPMCRSIWQGPPLCAYKQTGPLEMLLHALFAIVRNFRVCEALF
jgi:hypothetical protein